MDNNTYMEKSSRSVSEIFNCPPNEHFCQQLRNVMGDIIRTGVSADALKRTIFYGKEFEYFLAQSSLLNRLNGLPAVRFDAKFVQAEEEGRIKQPTMHGIFGVVTESAELIEALAAAVIDEEPLDRTNVIEEAGDLLWYIALILRSVDSSIDEAMDRNIAKLEKRYKEKFTTEQALNRDLATERKILAGEKQ